MAWFPLPEFSLGSDSEDNLENDDAKLVAGLAERLLSSELKISGHPAAVAGRRVKDDICFSILSPSIVYAKDQLYNAPFFTVTFKMTGLTVINGIIRTRIIKNHS